MIETPWLKDHVNVLLTTSGEPPDAQLVMKKLSSLDYFSVNIKPAYFQLLLYCIKDDSDVVREKAAGLVIQLFLSAKSARSLYGLLGPVRLVTEDLEDICKHFTAQKRWQLIAVASLSRHGHTRQKAVKLLIESRQPLAIRYLLLRVKDCVPEISREAIVGVKSYMEPAWAGQFVEELYWVQRLRDASREGVDNLYFDINAFLTDFHPSVLLGMLTDDESRRKQLFQYYNRFRVYGHITRPVILKDKSFSIRRLMFPVSEHSPDYERKPTLRRLLHDKNPAIRYAALKECETYFPDFENHIIYMLSDPAACVRNLARHYLIANDEIPLICYVEHLQKGERLPGIIQGMSELGSERAIPILEKFIMSKDPAIQLASLKGLRRLGSPEAVEYAMVFLISPVRRIRNCSIKILAVHHDLSVLERIRAFFPHGGRVFKESFLKIFYLIGGWKVLADLLIGVCDDDEVISKLALKYLKRWLKRPSYIRYKPVPYDMCRIAETMLKTDPARLGLLENELTAWTGFVDSIKRFRDETNDE